MRWLGICAACILLAIPAWGQSTDFQQLLSGQNVPLNLKLKDLDGTWRHLGITSPDLQKNGLGDLMSQILPMAMMSGNGGGGKGSSEEAMGMAFLSMLFGGGGGSSAPVFYTKGQTVTLSGETFLVAYQAPKTGINFMQLMMQSQQNGGKEPDWSKLAGDKLTGDSMLSLSLLNIKNITTFSDIRPFDLQKELDESNAAGGGLMDLLYKQAEKPDTADTAAPAPPDVHAEPAEPEAADVAPEIQAALAADGKLSGKGNQIQVKADGKAIVLTGRVATANLKQRASNLAHQALKEMGLNFTLQNRLTVRSR